MTANRGISLRYILLALSMCPGWAMAAGALSQPFVIGFASPPLAVEAKGMGNAVVADGTLFNASAYNPALLANNSDFAEVHLELNLGNDIIGMADYLTNSDNLNNLQNSVQNINSSFQSMQNALSQIGSGTVNSNTVNQFNDGVNGVQTAVNSMNKALAEATDKTIQVGAGLNIAFKIDDHFGFQAYNTTQAVVQVGRGNLITALQNLTLPNLAGTSFQDAQAAAVSMYNNAQSVVNVFLTPAQQSQLSGAVSTLANKGSGVNQSDIQTFANTVSSILSNESTNLSQQALFNDIAPVEVVTLSDTVLMGTYCTRPLEDDKALSLGVNLKAINRRIASINSTYLSNQNSSSFNDIGNDLKNDIQQTTWRWGVDLGAVYEFSDPKVSVGVAATDIFHNTATLNTTSGDPLYGMVTDPAPTVIRLGASYKPIRELTLNCDYDDLFSNTSYFQGLDVFYHIDFGFNYNLGGILQLRGGVTNGNLCGGLGLPLGIQYAFAVDNLTQSYNHYLQFDVAF